MWWEAVWRLLGTHIVFADVDAEGGSDQHRLMFEGQPTARVDMTAGALYAVAGNISWVYYGQVTPEKKIGFFLRRDREPVDPAIVLATPIMSVTTVNYPSITRAIRAGRWKKLGRFTTTEALIKPRPSVLWPVGTLIVTVCMADMPDHNTRVDDPTIQDMELMAVWDAEHNIPARLTADFGVEEAEWHVGGSVRRERQITEERAKRFTDQPQHRLPANWVPTDVR